MLTIKQNVMHGEIYDYMKIKEAKNGWILCYDEKVKNPMMPESTYDDSYTYKENKMVFEEKEGVSNEQALNSALEKMKELLLANKKMSTEKRGS